jgi:hypothetical protein
LLVLLVAMLVLQVVPQVTVVQLILQPEPVAVVALAAM